MTYRPALSVTAECVVFRLTSVTATFASGTADCEVSVTTPRTEAVYDCAKTSADNSIMPATSTTGSKKEQSGVELFLWDHASLRQAHRRNASRHIWRAWRPPRGMLTG